MAKAKAKKQKSVKPYATALSSGGVDARVTVSLNLLEFWKILESRARRLPPKKRRALKGVIQGFWVLSTEALNILNGIEAEIGEGPQPPPKKSRKA